MGQPVNGVLVRSDLVLLGLWLLSVYLGEGVCCLSVLSSEFFFFFSHPVLELFFQFLVGW